MEVADPQGPYGARGVGEMTMMLLAPAILDAIHDATGIWFSRIPVKAEDVLLALKAKKKGSEGAEASEGSHQPLQTL